MTFITNLYKKLVIPVALQVAKQLKSWILGNLEILGKFQIRVETYPSGQSPFQKQNFSNSNSLPSRSKTLVVTLVIF